MLLGYMKTLTLAPCKKTTHNELRNLFIKTHLISIKVTASLQYHGFWWKIRLELSTNNTTVTMRPNHLPPNAAIVGTILLHLGLVDISHALASIPRNLLLCVHSLNLDQRGVWVLVRLGPEPSSPSNI
jgi:hypothetical protein